MAAESGICPEANAFDIACSSPVNPPEKSNAGLVGKVVVVTD
jgi:hypothetical protein